MKYTDEQSVKNYRLRSIDAAFSDQFDAWNDGISRMMDNMAGITLVTDTETTHKYDGNGTQELTIDPVRSISDVSVGGTTKTPLQYPANYDVKHSLEFESDVFTRGKQNIEVTGFHARHQSLDDAPDIKLAATILLSLLINTNDKQIDGAKTVKLYNYSITYKDEKERADYQWALGVIDSYKLHAF